jgi:hypothetical protein
MGDHLPVGQYIWTCEKRVAGRQGTGIAGFTVSPAAVGSGPGHFHFFNSINGYYFAEIIEAVLPSVTICRQSTFRMFSWFLLVSSHTH